MQRRDFLKYFGIGASVVPLIGGMPKTDTVAKLIEEPKVDIKVVPKMPPEAMMDFFLQREPLRMQVSFSSRDDRAVVLDCHTCIEECAFYVGVSEGLSWELRGNVWRSSPLRMPERKTPELRVFNH